MPRGRKRAVENSQESPKHKQARQKNANNKRASRAANRAAGHSALQPRQAFTPQEPLGDRTNIQDEQLTPQSAAAALRARDRDRQRRRRAAYNASQAAAQQAADTGNSQPETQQLLSPMAQSVPLTPQSVPLTPQSAAAANRARKRDWQRQQRAARRADQAATEQAADTASRRQARQRRQSNMPQTAYIRHARQRLQSPMPQSATHQRSQNASLWGRAMFAVNSLDSPQANSQPLFQDLLRQSQSGTQPLAPGMPSPAMQPAPPFLTPASQAVSSQRQPAPAASQAEAQPQLELLEQQWQQVLCGPTPAGPQHLPIGQLDFDFLQLVTASAPIMTESELQRQANHIVDVARYGRQADLDLWVRQLVMASQQRDQQQQQQAQQVQRQFQQQQQQQQQQEQERREAEAQGGPMPALDSWWQEMYDQRQLPEWFYEPIGELEYDMLQLVVMARPDITHAELYDIAQSIVDPIAYIGREADLEHWLIELLDSTSYQPSDGGQADDITDPPHSQEGHDPSAAAESGQPRNPQQGLPYPSCHIDTALFRKFAEAPEHVCSSCRKTLYKDSGHAPRQSNPKRQEVADLLGQHDENVGPDNLWLCAGCAKHLYQGKVPAVSIANDMGLAACPPELQDLNYMELRMISPVQTFQSMVQLCKGQTAAKGVAISFPFDVEHYANVLPRPEDEGLISIVVPPHETPEAREQREQQEQRRQQEAEQAMQNAGNSQSSSQGPEGADRVVPSIDHNAEMQHGAPGAAQRQPGQPAGNGVQHVRIYHVRWSKIRAALLWLKANNPFFEDIDIQIPEGPDLQPTAGEFNNAPIDQMQHYLAVDNQPQLARGALDTALGASDAQPAQSGAANTEAAPGPRVAERSCFVLNRVDAQPLSIHVKPMSPLAESSL